MLTAKPAPTPTVVSAPTAPSLASGSDSNSESALDSENAADGVEASTSSAVTGQPSTTAGAGEMDDENAYDISVDPFASYFDSALAQPTDESGEPLPPKVLITTSSKSTKVAFDFCEELVGVIPGAEFIRRKKNKGFEIGRVAGWASGRGYGSILVVNEDQKKCSASPPFSRFDEN